MKLSNKTYLLIFTIVTTILYTSCASENRDRSKNSISFDEDHVEKGVNVEETLSNNTQNKILKEGRSNRFNKTWKKKAKQQLETIQDLIIILQDSTLNYDFKKEIDNQLIELNVSKDVVINIKNSESINFKKFNYNTNNDTLIIRFNNHNKVWYTKFIIENKLKQFGETTENIVQIKLVKIESE